MMQTNRKIQNRLRRRTKTRKHQMQLAERQAGLVRICVRRSSNHFSAQAIERNRTLASITTSSKAFKAEHVKTGNAAAAHAAGVMFGQMLKGKGVERIAFDRSGYKYHGRVAAFAQGLRDSELQF